MKPVLSLSRASLFIICAFGLGLTSCVGAGTYQRGIQSALDHDQEYPVKQYGEESQIVGMIPANLDLASGDGQLHVRAKSDRRAAISLLFDGVKDGKICFIHPLLEKVFNFGEQERERVERIGRSYQLAVELAGPLASPGMKGHSFDGGSPLEVVDVGSPETVTSRSGTRYISMPMRRCGPEPKAPVGVTPAFLTVVVKPNGGVELSTDPYVLVWQLYGSPDAKPKTPAEAPATQPTRPGTPETAPPTTTEIPTSNQNVLDTLRAAKKFSTFVRALEKTGVDKLLAAEGPYTVFAPTDDAFTKLSKAELDAWFADKKKLTDQVKLHVIPRELTSAFLITQNGARYKTLRGTYTLFLDVRDDRFRVEDGLATRPETRCKNGLVYAIDTVVQLAGDR